MRITPEGRTRSDDTLWADWRTGWTRVARCSIRGVLAMRVVNFSEARSSLKSLIDQVIDDADYTIIARRDAPDAVLMSTDTFSSLMETVHLLKTPANAPHLARSIARYRHGKAGGCGLDDAD